MSTTGLHDCLRRAHAYAAAELANERALAAAVKDTSYPARYVRAREEQAERLGKALRYLTCALDALGGA